MPWRSLSGRTKVINIASIDGIAVNPQETYSYAASKAGFIHLTKRMALKLIEDNIAVSALAPGAFKSDMNVMARDHGDQVAQLIPARRIGRDVTYEDVGRCREETLFETDLPYLTHAEPPRRFVF